MPGSVVPTLGKHLTHVLISGSSRLVLPFYELASFAITAEQDGMKPQETGVANMP